MKNTTYINNDILFKMYGGADVVDSLTNLNEQLKKTFDENIIFTKKIIDQLNELTKNSTNTTTTEETKQKFSELNLQLQTIFNQISEFKTQYQKGVSNDVPNDEYINQVNTIKEITNTFTDNYLTLKLSEQTVFVTEPIDVKAITSSLNEIAKNANDTVEKLLKNKNDTINESKENIEKQSKEIATFIKDFESQFQTIIKTTTHIENINNEFEQYVNITFGDANTAKIFLVTQTEEMQDMIVFSQINISPNVNSDDNDNLNILTNSIEEGKEGKEGKEGNKDQLGRYLTDATILTGLIHTGGSLNKTINDHYDQLMNINNKIMEFRTTINKFKKVSMEYNIRYIQVYNHLLFIVNYLKLVIMNKDSNYLVYQYLGKGVVSYYASIIKRIRLDIDQKKTSKIGKYFYKYHYINIEILCNFLNYLYGNWKDLPFKDDKKNITKKALLKIHLFDNKYSPLMKKCIFIFNSMKDILDKYYSEFSPPVGIYLRINDWESQGGLPEKLFDVGTKLGYINNESLKRCNVNKKKDDKNEQLLEANIDKASQVEFKEVFDPTNFESNEDLAKYMAIPAFLQEGKSIMLITYGYSGVGKTFTIFGSDKNSGVLQTSLNNIQQKESLYYRAYEIYGLAVPYELYWAKPPDKYYHFIYDYSGDKIKKYNAGDMSAYLDQIKTSDIDESSSFKLLTDDLLKNFADIVGKIDEKRKENGTIKRTINNRESSRSIMVYDFKIKLKNKSKMVNFVVMDLPGKEHIVETFINDPPKGEYECIKIKNLHGLSNELLKRMAYFSPLSLPLNLPIAKIIIEEYKRYNPKIYLQYNYFGVNVIKNDTKPNQLYNYYTKKDSTLTQVSITYQDVDKEISTVEKDTKHPDKTLKAIDIEINTKKYAIEIMRNIIQFNHFDLLKVIYNKIFGYPDLNDNMYLQQTTGPEKYKCSTHDSYAITPFEGYYINENITGLISTLLRKLDLSNNFIDEQTSVYKPLFNVLVGTSYGIGAIPDKKENKCANESTSKEANEQELIALTYFFRRFVYATDSNKKDTYKEHMTELLTFYQEGLKQGNENNNNYKYMGHPLHYWLGDDKIYDFNKAYRKDCPPIKTILKPYFDIIDNFYVFYVVSNNNEAKCEKQIKLIADSSDFLMELSKFEPGKYKEKKIQEEKTRKKQEEETRKK